MANDVFDCCNCTDALMSSSNVDIFYEKYQPCGNVLPDTVEYLAKFKGSKRHYLVLLQSSGYGKTRACIELLKTHRGLYLLCGNVEGGFQQCEIIRKLLLMDRFDAKAAVVFLSKLDEFIKSHGSAEELFKAQFDESNSLYRNQFEDPNKLLTKSPSSEKQEMQVKAERVDIDLKSVKANLDAFALGHEGDDQDHAQEASSTQQSRMSLLVFDEAHNIPENIMGILKVALDQFDIIGVFLSTMGNVSKLLPSIHSSRMMRTSMQPICQLFTSDLHFRRGDTTLRNKLVAGRPLWHNMLMTRGQNDLSLLVEYAATRLCGDEEEGVKDDSAKVSLFWCRFGGLNPSNEMVAANFVTRHMATYLHVETSVHENDRLVTTSIGYPSEPILAEASAYRTSCFADRRGCDKYDVLRAVFLDVQRSGGIVKLDKGDLGELTACALVGYQLDYLRERMFAEVGYNPNKEQCMSSPVSLDVFLIALYNGVTEVFHDDPEIQQLSNFAVNATHFVRLPFNTNYAACATAIERGAGIITRENSRGVDFFIEAVRVPKSAINEISSSGASLNDDNDSTKSSTAESEEDEDVEDEGEDMAGHSCKKVRSDLGPASLSETTAGGWKPGEGLQCVGNFIAPDEMAAENAVGTRSGTPEDTEEKIVAEEFIASASSSAVEVSQGAYGNVASATHGDDQNENEDAQCVMEVAECNREVSSSTSDRCFNNDDDSPPANATKVSKARTASSSVASAESGGHCRKKLRRDPSLPETAAGGAKPGEGLQRLGKFDGHVVFLTERGAHVYFVRDDTMKSGFARKYVDVKYRGRYDALTGDEEDVVSFNEVTPVPPRIHDNIHVRFTVKNYASDISEALAEKFLNAVDAECEPAHAVQSEGEEMLRVTVLINVGPGHVEPFVSVGRNKQTRSRAAESIHLKIAVGLNREDDRCFQYFEKPVLKILREMAASQLKKRQSEMKLVLGGAFWDVMNKTEQL